MTGRIRAAGRFWSVNEWLYHDWTCPRMTATSFRMDEGYPFLLQPRRAITRRQARHMAPAQGCCQPPDLRERSTP